MINVKKTVTNSSLTLIHKYIFFFFISLSVVNCATIVKDSEQSISVDSDPRSSHCIISQGNKTILSRKTPFVMHVDRSSKDIISRCEKEGYHDSTEINKSKSNGWAWGNIIFGGIIGLLVDIATGKMWDYHSSIFVNLQKEEVKNRELHPIDNNISQLIEIVKIKKNKALAVFPNSLKFDINKVFFIKKETSLNPKRMPSSKKRIFLIKIKRMKKNKALVIFKRNLEIEIGKYILCSSKHQCD